MKNRAYKIIHITPHLGGGVGKVILNYLAKVKNDSHFKHEVICLDYVNNNVVKLANDIGLRLLDKMANKKQILLRILSEADIVLIHWWNHPLLYDFLVRTKLPPCRLIIWSHISGFYPPSVFTKKILRYPDIFVFTTPISLKTKEVMSLTSNQKKMLYTVWSTGGVEHVKSIKIKKHSGFNIGYIGTVDYAKIHPNFLNICNKINIPKVKFIVCGGANEKEIKKEAEKKGIESKFIFTGLVPDINKYLSIFDIFGYPLAPYHYGTCDQSLAESMAAGIAPVVLENKMEKYMVKNEKTGIVAKSEDSYIKKIQILYSDKALRKLLSRNAKEYAVKNFSIDKMIKDWEVIFKKTLAIPKNRKSWDIKQNKKIKPWDVFLESLGDYGKPFILYYSVGNIEKRKIVKKIKKLAKFPNWQAKTKGTVHHYNYFFPKDNRLLRLSQLMKK